MECKDKGAGYFFQQIFCKNFFQHFLQVPGWLSVPVMVWLLHTKEQPTRESQPKLHSMPYFYVPTRAPHWRQALLLLTFSLCSLLLFAQKTAINSGAWSDVGTWDTGVPGPADDVSIASGVTVTIDGNASAASVQINNGSGAATATLLFQAGSQLTVTNYVSLGASNGAAGVLDMNAGGTLSAAGFATNVAAAGNLWTPGAGTVLLNGNNTLPALFTAFNNLTVQGSGRSTTAGSNLSLSGALSIAANALFDMGAYTLSFAGGALLSNNGTLQTQNTSAAPLPSGLSWGNVAAGTGTVLYNAATGGQTIVAGTYNNLYLSHGAGSTVSNAGGTLLIGGEVATLTTGTTLNMGTYQLLPAPLGGIGSQTNVGTIRTQFVGANSSDLAVPSGRNWGGTFIYDAPTGGQKIVFGTYNNLTVQSTGTDESSSIVVNGNFVTAPGAVIDLNQETITGSFDASGHAGNLIVRGSTPYPAGKTFGGTVTYDGTVAQTVRSGNYENLSITTFRSSDLTLEGVIAVAGDLLFSSVLENGAQFQTAGSLFQFNGSGTQQLTVTAHRSGPTVDFVFNDITFSGGGQKTLASPLYAGGTVTFTNGIVVTDATNLLQLNDGATVNGGSTASYVQGPIRRIGTTAFTFPLGGSGVYAPLSLSAPGSNGDFTARYVRANAQGLGQMMQSPVTKVSGCEYWNLVKNAGANNPTVTLSWSAESGCNGAGPYVGNPATLVVVRFDGAAWISQGNSGTSGNAGAGTVTSDPMTDFDNITLGSIGTDNLLPVRFIAVSATPRSGAVDLRWTVAAEFNVARYEVLRGTDGRSFVPVARLDAGQRTAYTATDVQPLAGTAYYRVRAVDADGRETLSAVLRVRPAAADAALELYPVPVRNGALLLRSDRLDAGAYELRIVDANGRTLQQELLQHSGGALGRSLTLPAGMAAGRYQLLLSGAGTVQSIPFVVQ